MEEKLKLYNMQQVKVKIKKLAEGGGPKPLYNQDDALGLDAYFLPMESKEPDGKKINHMQKEVPEEIANVELEKDEVVFDLVSEIPQMRIVGGKPHSKGGTPAILPEGAFVFSEHLKMTPEEAKVLGLGGKNLSYASGIKKYVKDFNNSVKDMETEEDKISKDTATLNVQNIKTKAAKIALLQESSKGFPTGVPDFVEMKKGGLFKMQDAGQFTEREGRKYKIVTAKDVEGRIPNYSTPEFEYYDEFGKKISGKKGSVDFNRAFAAAKKQGLPEFSWRGKKFTTQVAGRTPDNFLAVPNKIIEDENMPKYPQPFEDTITDIPVIAPEPKQQAQPQNPQDNSIKPDNAGKMFTKPFTDTGYGWMEAVGIGAAAMQPINRYAPVKKAINPQALQFRPVDFEAQRQSVKGQVAQAQDVNTLISPSSASASVRNAQLLGQSLNALNESFMNEFNTNQLGYQQVEGQNAQFRQQADTFNTQMADQYDTQYAQLNENFDARKAQRTRQTLQQWQVAERNRQARNLLNYTMTDYAIGPNQEIMQVPQTEEQRMARITGMSGAGSAQEGNIFDQVKALQEQAKQRGITLTNSEALNLVNKMYPKWTETDTDNDGVPNTVRRNTSNPSSLNMMFNVLRNQGLL